MPEYKSCDEWLQARILTFLSSSGVVMSNNLHSQGGQLVHNAAKMMDAATTAKINSGAFTFSPFLLNI